MPELKMKVRIIIIIFTILISNLIFGQSFDKKKLTEELINTILKQDSISNKIFDFPLNITDYEFEGDYSTERVLPEAFIVDSTGQKILTQTICTVPTEFSSPIWKIIKTLDVNYDSSYYLEQILNSDQTFWSKRKMVFNKKVKFVKWKWRRFYHEINNFSTPIFSKNGDIAIIKFGSINGKSMQEKMNRILIFRKTGNQWELIKMIESIKNWG